MSLDLNSTAAQIESMVVDLQARQGERVRRVESAFIALNEFQLDRYLDISNESQGGRYRIVPEILEHPSSVYKPDLPPGNFRVVSSDGSHIEVDRHLAVRCFLINVGVSALTYGDYPNATLYSVPRLYAAQEDLVISEIATGRQQSIEGAVLGAKRAVAEVSILAEEASGLDSNTPSIYLVDGSLVMMGLVGHGYHDFVLRELIEDGFIKSMNHIRDFSENRSFGLASYISMPAHSDVVNALNVTSCVYPIKDSNLRCDNSSFSTNPCEKCISGVLDRDIFWKLLKPGERSSVFGVNSPVVENHYLGTGITFFYVNVGTENGRVEMPSWVSDNRSSLDLVHSLIVDQCERGRGYPVALMEAHEQAVVGVSDRRNFVQLVEQVLHKKGSDVYTSEKARSKRLRWL